MKQLPSKGSLFSFFLLFLLAGCSGGPSEQGETRPFAPQGSAPSSGLAQVTYSAPSGWVKEQPASNFRQDQFRLPRAEGDPDDAEMAVFYFGPGQGGTVEANIQRWIGQFSEPGGGSVQDDAQTSQRTVNGQTVTILDVRGTYQASGMGPMTPPGEPRPDYRLLAAIIETSSGPWFFKLTGPQNTVSKWEESFDQFVGTLKVN